MKKIVSVSLGTSKRNKSHVIELLGTTFQIERIGTDGSLEKFANMFKELDGNVDALGVGGADIYVAAGDRKYEFKQIKKLVSGATKTPVVDGSGLKHTLERETIRHLHNEKIIDFTTSKVLLVSAIDRYGMAQTLDQVCPNVVYGDLIFALGLPLPLRKYSSIELIGKLLLPIITMLPIQWFYPTGEKQEQRTPKFGKYFDEADVIAGYWHFIRRYAPEKMIGKTIITQTLRKADLEWLKSCGVARAITTTPVMGGETFATNVMEGVIVALSEKSPDQLDEQFYLDTLNKLDWKPNVIELQPCLCEVK